MAAVKVEIAGKEYAGVVTDADKMFFLSLLFLDAHERNVLKDRGTQAALTLMGPRMEKLLQETISDRKKELGVKRLTDEEIEAVNETFYQGIGEGVFTKVNSDREIRLSFAQRVLEIFPEMSSEFVSYQRYIDAMGNTHEKGSLRLSMEELMDVVLVCLKDEETEKQLEKVRAESDRQKTPKEKESFQELIAKLSPEQIRKIKESA